MSGHTPGPWTVGVSNSVITSAPADLRVICQPFTDATYGPILSSEEQRANAKLMAAAPDLLEALERAIFELDIYSWVHHPKGCDGAREFNLVRSNARAAIARAKGEA